MTNPFRSPIHAKQKESPRQELESIQKLRFPAIFVAILVFPIFLLSAYTEAIRGGDVLGGALFAIAAFLCAVCTVLAFRRSIIVSWAVLVVAIFLALVPAALLS